MSREIERQVVIDDTSQSVHARTKACLPSAALGDIPHAFPRKFHLPYRDLYEVIAESRTNVRGKRETCWLSLDRGIFKFPTAGPSILRIVIQFRFATWELSHYDLRYYSSISSLWKIVKLIDLLYIRNLMFYKINIKFIKKLFAISSYFLFWFLMSLILVYRVTYIGFSRLK